MGIGRLQPDSLVEIDYCNESGSVSHRRIRIISSNHARNGNTYLRAWCFLRGEERTFRADRILEWREITSPSQRPIVVPAKEPQIFAARVAPAGSAQSSTAPAAAASSTPYPWPQVQVIRRTASKSRASSGIGSAVAAGIAIAFIRFVIGGGAAQAPRAQAFVISKSVTQVVATASPARVTPAKDPVKVDAAVIRAMNFRDATGIHSAPLERLYASADANRNGLLSWAELAAFQRNIRARYRYLSNNTVLKPDEFLAQGGGDCDDWAELTCGLLRYWCWDPYVGCFESPAGDEGHAICLIRVSRVEPGFASFAIPEGSTLNNDGVAAGSYVPVDYDVVGGITNAMGRNWKLDALFVPERIYGSAM
jgi:hypothetical protein